MKMWSLEWRMCEFALASTALLRCARSQHPFPLRRSYVAEGVRVLVVFFMSSARTKSSEASRLLKPLLSCGCRRQHRYLDLCRRRRRRRRRRCCLAPLCTRSASWPFDGHHLCSLRSLRRRRRATNPRRRQRRRTPPPLAGIRRRRRDVCCGARTRWCSLPAVAAPPPSLGRGSVPRCERRGLYCCSAGVVVAAIGAGAADAAGAGAGAGARAGAVLAAETLELPREPCKVRVLRHSSRREATAAMPLCYCCLGRGTLGKLPFGGAIIDRRALRSRTSIPLLESKERY